MQFYRYFKGHEKAGKWKAVPVEQEAEAFARTRYGFYTILGVNEAPEGGVAVSSNALYTGPFYLDIDSKDINKSIKAAKKVLDKLGAAQIKETELNIWASGKKGFHITVPMGIFCDDYALPRLPWIYLHVMKCMKFHAIGEEIDQSVYSAGKGRMWRIANRERADNQQYKVPISPDELADITEETYRKLCSAPREDLPIHINGKKNSTIQGFYTFALARAAEMRRPKSTLIDANLREALGEEVVPPCVRNLADGTNFKDDIGFNQRSIQMNKALRAFVPNEQQDTFIEQFVHSNEGETHNTPESRREHLNRGRRTVQSGSDYEWSCRSILSILKSAPCNECNICFIKDQQDAEDDAEEKVSLREMAQRLIDAESPTPAAEGAGGDGGGDEPPDDPDEPEAPKPSRPKSDRPQELNDAMEGLTFTDDGYAFITGKGELRRVSNFILRFTKVYYEYIPNLEEERRVSTAAEVYVGHRKVGTVMVEEAAWQSKSAFIGTFGGLSNCAFYGKDDDVQRMKSTLMADIDKTTTKIRRVHSCGIHHLRVGEQDVFTYVEPGWSLDNYGHEDTYSLSGQMPAAPRLKATMPLVEGQGDEQTTLLLGNLFKINSPENVSRIVGWMMACFLKQHIFSYRNEFPLLCVWGKAGAGKTATSGMFSSLHGTEYLSGGAAGAQHSPLSLGGEASSNFALWMFISSSMTAPRIVEEYNKKNLQKKYDIFSEYFKEVWNQHSVKRGTIRNQKHHGTGVIDASTVDIPMTGPTVIISEQSLEVPALKHRTVEVQLDDEQRATPEVRKAWAIVSPRWRGFQRFAKTAYMEALNISVDQIQTWIAEFDDKIPSIIGDRPHYSFCVLGMGFKFLEHLSRKYNLKLGAEIAKMQDDLIEYAMVNAHEIAVEKTRTEVDIVLGEIAGMVELSKGESMYKWITKDHYMREGNTLLLDGMVAHSQYVRYMVGQHKQIAIEHYNQFKQLLRSEDYCESSEYQEPTFARGRKVLKINLAKLALRGIDVNVFEGI